MTVHLRLKPDAKPKHISRPIALALEEPVNEELDRLVKNGILTPVDFSEWAAPIVVARKACDPRQTLIVAADASSIVIDGVLLQRAPDGQVKAVFHMSKALTKTQQNYSQIEKEALALVTAVERFRKFVYGRHFVLQTDHHPLPV